MRLHFTPALDAYKAGLVPIVDSGYYADQRRADLFFVRHMEPLWLAELAKSGLVLEADELYKRMGITPTMVLILHLFGRTVHRVGLGRKPVHMISAWPPSRLKDPDEFPILFEGISTPDIARLIGRSRSAVSTALRRIKGDDPDGFFALRLATVLSSHMAITLDGMFDSQVRFAFTYDIYQRFIDIATEARISDSTRTRQTIEWSESGKDKAFFKPALQEWAERAEASDVQLSLGAEIEGKATAAE